MQIFPFHLKWCDSYVLVPLAPFKVEQKNLNKNRANVERHFTRNYSTLEEKFPAGDARKATIAKLKFKAEQSTSAFLFTLYF